MTKVRVYCSILCCFLLAGCVGLGDDNTPEPTPLAAYPYQFQPLLLWSVATGRGMDEDFLRLRPVIDENKIFVASKSGIVTALELTHGHKLWQKRMKQTITSGPAVANGFVIIVTKQLQAIALSANSGDILWRASLPNQVLAPPAVGSGHIILKTVDGQIIALALQTGQVLWTYTHGAPLLILRPSSAAQIINNKIVVGFSDGQFVALNLKNGNLLWERTIAFPQGFTATDQLIDIAANPILSCNVIYVVTYQGQLAAVSLQTGHVLWQRSFSSYSGLAVGHHLYATDTEGNIWAFNRITGRLLWKQPYLKHRVLTAPVIFGNSLIVGDKEGYIHWLALSDGHPLARDLVHDDASIIANPVVRYPIVCILTREGGLSAWTHAALPV
ncbi:outer membrane protein assembly factor BamB [Rickettsiella grylli]|uniref:outer membrane protein assembly factor BamB n=1 Tax=Rickettsiella grylli TaxID=59196 RepID=UPI0008FD0D1C|nr:outer membrane protein assembly factor BamB [Rickettsiella grylli]OJA00819.1 outer membrane protein assembly factor BamB [Rickettsiella grylli]